MTKQLLTLTLLINSCILPEALAQSVASFVKDGAEKEFALAYPEAGKHFVDTYVIGSDGWQRRKMQKIFLNGTQAQKFILGQGFAVVSGATVKSLNVEREPISIKTEDMVWTTENEWNWDWEVRYSEWVRANVNEGFFRRFGVATDCADVAISSRWIFARINHLPMANTLAGSGRIFSNEVVRSDLVRLPKAEAWYDDLRFRAALDYVLDTTFTHSLMADSYPVAVSPETFLPGVHHLNLYSAQTGHTMLVSDMSRVLGGVRVIYSTVPRAIRELWGEYFQQYSQYESSAEGGFLRVRWAYKYGNSIRLKTATSMPDYSNMQYEPSFMRGHYSFSEALEAHLNLNITPSERLILGTKMLLDKVRARVVVVERGYAVCQVEDCGPESANYETWSTPNRDRKLVELLDSLEDLVTDRDTQFIWDTFLRVNQITVEGRNLFFKDILERLNNDRASFDPRERPLRRWGY